MDPIKRTIESATENVEGGGEPFAFVILRDDEVLAESPNLAYRRTTPPPTPRSAVKEACTKLGTESLEGCEIYVLAHPVCLDALYHASSDRVVFVTERDRYAEYKDDWRYFELGTFSDGYPKPWPERRLPMRHVPDGSSLAVYERWR